jgi:predicted alpha/beta-hydrolase family hydrolase
VSADRLPDIVTTGDRDAATHLVLAHGAGAGMHSPWLDRFAGLLAAHGLCVHRFEFAYMAARRTGGSRRPPPRAETLSGEYAVVARHLAATLGKDRRLIIGGKSMGGRVASLVADDLFKAHTVAGLVCLGYPFHPVGQPAKLRTAHLAGLACPTLIVQGTRDPFGTSEDVAGYALAPAISLRWIDNGDHDFKGAGRGAMDDAAGKVAAFAASV